ncbi:MAG: endonuclease III, partial [Firmicutes bacterium]|nr:endonuclease III [Bacillota bacterium]
MDSVQRANQIVERIYALIGEAKCELNYETPFQLLIAVILSAQCTDVRVNIVTKDLFFVAPTASKLAGLEVSDIEQIIKSLGLYRAKAKNIKQCAVDLVGRFEGVVPNTREALMSLA